MKSVFAIASLVLTASLFAQPVPRCSGTYMTLNATSGQELTLPVTPVEGATRYRVQIASQWSFSGPSHFLMQGTIADQTFSPGTPIRETFYNTQGAFKGYVYVAVISEVPQNDGSRSLCAQDFLVEIQPDTILGGNSTRVVVPVAGSVHGAFNSVFKTRLLLENRWDVGTISGRIFFHRAGVPGSVLSDPSLPYLLQPHTFATFDDVIGAMHLDGVVGSLDIYPDVAPSGVYALPQVRADLISIGANGGEYSASIPAVTTNGGYDGALTGTPQFLIEPPRNKRISVGIRSLSDPVEITAFLITPERTERARVTRSYAADFYEQTPLSSWFNDQQQPGDTILFLIRPASGSQWTAGAIVFFAETDNTTNDVTIVTPSDLQVLNQSLVACAEGSGCAVLNRF